MQADLTAADQGLRTLKGIIRLGELSATGRDQVNTLLSQIAPHGEPFRDVQSIWEEKVFHTIVAPMIDGSGRPPELTAFELRLGIFPDDSFASVQCRMAFQVPNLPTLIVTISDIGKPAPLVFEATLVASLFDETKIDLLDPDPLKLGNPFFKPYAMAVQKLRLLAMRWQQASTLPFRPFSERGQMWRAQSSDGRVVTEQEYREGRLNPRSRSFDQKLLEVEWNNGPGYQELLDHCSDFARVSKAALGQDVVYNVVPLRRPHPDAADDMAVEPPLRRRRREDRE